MAVSDSGSSVSKSGSFCWEVIFDLPKKRLRLEEIAQISSDPEFWSDQDTAQAVSKEGASLEAQLAGFESTEQAIGDLTALLELYVETEDDSLPKELEREYKKIDAELTAFEMTRLLSGPHDSQSAIMEINAGAGGVDSQDWAEMLLRMYLRWAERKGLRAQVLDSSAGEEAGIRSATIIFEGDHAYGYLRSERGVHRLVRISPFDQNARRHTSFASVSVLPDVEADVEVEVREEDLRIDTYRASGAGGQHVNKTDSAVRLTHIPSGIVVACQSQRSQHNNKSAALKILKAKLYEIELEKRDEEMKKIAGEQMKIDFGSQIRSYVLHPYQMVKDNRTEAETGNVQAVLDGELDPFIEAFLLSEDHNESKE